MTSPTGGQQFYSALQEKAMAAVQDTFKSTLYPVQYPSQGDFKWNWQDGNQVFNDDTYQYVNALAKPGDVAGTVALSDAGGFANAYVAVLNAMEFSLSSGDQAELDKAQSDASVEAGTIVSDYETSFGTITPAQMTDAGVSTKLDYVISYVLGSQWSGATPPLSQTAMASAEDLTALLPNAPMSADPVITDVTTYLNLMQPVIGLKDQLQRNDWTLRQLKNNAMHPSESNGGMQTFHPNDGSVLAGYNDGWEISDSIASINNDLQNIGRTISIEMTTSQSSSSDLEVTMQGQAGFTIGSILEFSTAANVSYDMSKTKGTSTDCSVSITYAGYSMVSAGPAAWQQATNVGFYSADPISQAVANVGQDVTGFKFLNTPPYQFGSLASGGNFGLLTNLLISNYPTVSITYTNADYQTFSESWDEQASGSLTLFGFIPLGSVSQSAGGSSHSQSADNSTFTVTFSPSPEVTGVPQALKTAYVIGAAVANPGTTG
ncbi:hypothetical protein [Jatrophihabitans sp.]|jgi:hypothetical protein|uniref:hypothetical protein n=1 Tax=Jatrophihabitans sp. TaxID=1932789 RepID=UPI002F16C516